jgi:Kef-type K+ transport system membrane component KefB
MADRNFLTFVLFFDVQLQLCGGKTKEGVFVGVLLSMSSTAVVSSKHSKVEPCIFCCFLST